MLSKIIATAVTATILIMSLAQAQSVSQLGGPANYPPAGFSGQQFVDNNGCVFLRAGFGAAVNWVPRVNAGHQPLCGLTPSFGAAVEADIAGGLLAVAPAAARPVALVRVVRPTVPAKPFVAAAPPTLVAATLAAPSFGAVRARNVIPAPPKGYRLAWKDDRLNPLRGIGTAIGQAQQDQVWSRDIPARLVSATPLVAQPGITVSTMSAPAMQLEAAYIRVGTFGELANAAGVEMRLSALGMPVATSRITNQGRVMQVVYAGPFATRALARAALATTRSAGFPDAILK